MGAPVGNANRATQYRIKHALETCLDKRSKVEGRDALEAACEALIERSFSSLPDFKELADRLDGKPHQTVATQVDATVTVEVVRFGAGKAPK